MKKSIVSLIAAIMLMAPPAMAATGTNISTMDMQTTNQLSSSVPRKGKIGMDKTKNTLYLGDGSTTGGFTMAREDGKYSTANWAITEYFSILDEFSTGSPFETNADSYVITTTEAGAGSATEVLQDANSGTLLITNAAGDNDLDSIQSIKEHVKLTASKKTVAFARFKVSDATESDVLVGWVIRDTTPLTNTDGLYFIKGDGQEDYKFIANMNSTITSVSSVATGADDTYVTLGFECDGTTSCTPYVNGTAGTAITTNLPTDEELCLTVHIQNGEAVAKTATVDYWFVQQER